MIIIIETVGWIGTILYLLAYFLLSYRIIEKDKFYYLINILAAVLVAILSVYKNTLQSIFLNLFWGYLSYFAYKKKTFKFELIKVPLFNFAISSFLIIAFICLIIEEYYLAFDILAWLSVFTFITSYYLFAMSKIKLRLFDMYNFIAAMIIFPKMFIFENYQVAFLQLVWAGFALRSYLKN